MLERLSSLPALSQIPSLDQLWQQTLSGVSTKPKFAAHLELVVKRCPLVSELDFVPLVQGLIAAGHPAAALRLIELAPPSSSSSTKLVPLIEVGLFEVVYFKAPKTNTFFLSSSFFLLLLSNRVLSPRIMSLRVWIPSIICPVNLSYLRVSARF